MVKGIGLLLMNRVREIHTISQRPPVYVVVAIKPYDEPSTEVYVFDNWDAANRAWTYFMDKSQDVLVENCSICNNFEIGYEQK